MTPTTAVQLTLETCVHCMHELNHFIGDGNPGMCHQLQRPLLLLITWPDSNRLPCHSRQPSSRLSKHQFNLNLTTPSWISFLSSPLSPSLLIVWLVTFLFQFLFFLFPWSSHHLGVEVLVGSRHFDSWSSRLMLLFASAFIWVTFFK